MGPMGRLKTFFNKEKFDYLQGQVDPYEFHKCSYYMCKTFRLLDNEPIPKWTIIVPVLIYICGIIAAFLCFISTAHYVDVFKVPLFTESGTYFIVMMYKLLIISGTLCDKPHFHNFLVAIREDFEYICTKGSKYREKFFQNQLWTWKACILTAIFVGSIGSGMILCSFIALIYFLIRGTEGNRPLPFPFWCFELDFGKSPTYEIAFVFYNLCICTHTLTYIFMLQTQILWIRQIMSKADVIIWIIEDLLVDVKPANNMQQKENYEKMLQYRMRDIIKMHHSMYSLLADYAEAYKKHLMFEQKMCAPMVCLTAFCSAEKLDARENPGMMMLLCVASVILTGIPSYMCTLLAEKVQSIGDACWNAPFWNAPGKVIRPYFLLIIQRSSRPLQISAAGFEDVSLQTFADNIKVAYTGFNMLRQA